MTRILFTGNSHLGAIRMGWEVCSAQHPQVQAQFLGAPRETFDRFERRGSRFGLFDETSVPKGVLQAVKASMPELVVDLDGFDRIVMIGAGWGEISLLGLLQRHGIDAMRPATAGMQMLSVAAYEAFCADLSRSSGARAVVDRLGAARLTIIPRPMRSEALLEAGDGAGFAGLAACPDGLRAAVLRHQQVFAGVMGQAGAQVVAQPAETIGALGLTGRRWAVGAKRVTVRGVPREVIDHVHMTADYGALMVARLLDGSLIA